MSTSADTSRTDDDLVQMFEEKFAIYRGSKLDRLQHGHVKLLFSKFIETFTRKTGTSLRKRVNLVWGEPINIVYPDSTSIEIDRYGCYEEGLTKMVLNRVGPGMTFLDVGAHIGYYTMLASRLVGESGQVHSFEPTPSTFNILRTNAGSKRNVRLNQMALSSSSGEITIFDYGVEYMGSNSRYAARIDKASVSRLTPKAMVVAASSLDDYVEGLGITPNFVKIDAESSEYEILEGMSQVLESARPIVSVEVGDMDIEGVPTSRELITHLESKGYRATEFSQRQFAAHQIKDRYTYDNILFIPEG
jgi:FkbM family methyltransferase